MAQAYDFALDKIGMEIMSYQVWFFKIFYVFVMLIYLLNLDAAFLQKEMKN